MVVVMVKVQVMVEKLEVVIAEKVVVTVVGVSGGGGGALGGKEV